MGNEIVPEFTDAKMDLKEVKEKIRIESANQKVNDWAYNRIQDPEDCFGQSYNSSDEYCQKCTILASVDDRKEPLSVFCAELCGQTIEPKNKEVDGMDGMEKTVIEKPKKEKKEKRQTDVGIIREMVAAGKTEDEINIVMVPVYTARGYSEQAAKRGIRYRIKKLQGLVK